MPKVKLSELNSGGNIDMLVSRVPLTDTQISNYANGSDSLSGTILSNDPSNGNVKMLTVQNSGDYYVTLVATTSSSGSYSFNPATFPSETVLTSTAAAVSNAYPNYYVYTGDGNPTTFTLTGLTDPTKASVLLSYSPFTTFDASEWRSTGNASNISVPLETNGCNVTDNSNMHVAIIPATGYTANETYTLTAISAYPETALTKNVIYTAFSNPLITSSNVSNADYYIFSNDLSSGNQYIQIINTGGPADILLSSSQVSRLGVVNYLSGTQPSSKYTYSTLSNSNSVLETLSIGGNSLSLGSGIHIAVVPKTSTNAVYRIEVTQYASEDATQGVNNVVAGAIAYTGQVLYRFLITKVMYSPLQERMITQFQVH